jgi:hypothetical protein
MPSADKSAAMTRGILRGRKIRIFYHELTADGLAIPECSRKVAAGCR